MPRPSFTIEIAKDAHKALQKIPESHRVGIEKTISSLSHDPRPRGCVCLDKREGNPWRVRKGDRRIVYQILESERKIQVLLVEPRGDVYKGSLKGKSHK